MKLIIKPEIKLFKGRYEFLSNFYQHEPIRFDGMEANCVETLYQASKTTNPYSRSMILSCEKPGLARRKGKDVDLKPGWNHIRLGVMEELLNLKFKIPELRKKLINTDQAYLEESNEWGDMFWGTFRGVGQNHLGLLLMKIRDRLLEE